jgi:endonuclease/exonuclease/phosphatase family metal-dependent hydrolase
VLLVLVPVALTVWVFTASRPGRTVEGCLDGCATGASLRDQEARDDELSVLSLNMLHGFPKFARLGERLDLMAAEIKRTDPDIICLQEVPWRPGLGTAASMLAGRLGLNYAYVRANGNRWSILFEEGEAILSRYPLQSVEFVELTPRAGMFEHRVALRAVVSTPVTQVSVVVTHLTNGDPVVNREQSAALKAFVEPSLGEGAAIVAGDFNAAESSEQIQGLGWIDTHRAASPNGPAPTCCVDTLEAGPEEQLEERIDYVFLVADADHTPLVVGTGLACAQPRVVGDTYLWCSDHIGLLTTLRLSDPDPD